MLDATDPDQYAAELWPRTDLSRQALEKPVSRLTNTSRILKERNTRVFKGKHLQ